MVKLTTECYNHPGVCDHNTAGITKYVAPYIIKPSSITCDFNKHINPKIIQRKARHSKIETTL